MKKKLGKKKITKKKESYLGLRVVCDAMSLEEYFCEGPKIRVPPCSLPPLAGAHVGLAAVVIGFHDLGIEIACCFSVTDFVRR